MSAWDTAEVKIGKNVRSGGAPRETVVRSQSALNAAKRSGAAIVTEKKYAVGNSASVRFSLSLFDFYDRQNTNILTRNPP
jgi:hypothetical protein